MKRESTRPYEVRSVYPRRAGVGAALRTLFGETNSALPVDFEAMLAELDDQTRHRA
jgi:hypothetical protein